MGTTSWHTDGLDSDRAPVGEFFIIKEDEDLVIFSICEIEFSVHESSRECFPSIAREADKKRLISVLLLKAVRTGSYF
jgi:hypothetical protein